MWSYCGHLKFHMQFWLLDWIGGLVHLVNKCGSQKIYCFQVSESRLRCTSYKRSQVQIIFLSLNDLQRPFWVCVYNRTNYNMHVLLRSFFLFFLNLFLIIFMFLKLDYISKPTIKHQQKSDWKLGQNERTCALYDGLGHARFNVEYWWERIPNKLRWNKVHLISDTSDLDTSV